jgi:hypothetical protein
MPKRTVPELNSHSMAAAEVSFESLLKDAVAGIGEDGRIAAADVRRMRKARRGSHVRRSDFLAEPESVLGPFDALPAPARRALARAVAVDDRWRMAGYFLGAWHARLARWLWRLRDRLRWAGAARAAAEIVATAVQAGPFIALPAARTKWIALLGKLSRRPEPGALLAANGIEVRDLAVRYVRAIPQQPSYLGFAHDPAKHNTVGVVVGLDLVHNAQGYWLIESNMDCGFLYRAALYPEDPLVVSLLDAAVEGRYRRLVVVSGNTSVDDAMAQQFRTGAKTRGIDVEIFENLFHPRFGHPGTAPLPDFDGTHTLLVRNRNYKTALDRLVHHKRASSRALTIYQEESRDATFRLPVTTSDPRVSGADPEDPFPNLVFKMPEQDAGEGVFFLKAASAAHARDLLTETLRAAPARGAVSRLFARLQDGQGVYQPYVRTPWLPDRRLYKTRAYVLLTPIEIRYLAAHRVIGSDPVPQSLPLGIVRDQAPYLVTVRPGSRLEPLPPHEEPAVREAALGVGRGLARAIVHGFRTRTTHHPESLQ